MRHMHCARKLRDGPARGGRKVSKVLIYSNQVFVRKGIRCFLDTQDDVHISGDAEVPEGRALDAEVDGIAIVLLDLSGLSNPTETIRRIRRAMNDARIVVLCTVSTTDCAVDALDAGAAGIITHSCQPTELRIAMSRILN